MSVLFGRGFSSGRRHEDLEGLRGELCAVRGVEVGQVEVRQVQHHLRSLRQGAIQ